MESDVLAVADRNGNVICAAGRRNADWPVRAAGAAVSVGRNPRANSRTGAGATRDLKGAAYLSMPGGVFQFATSTLTLGDTFVGTLHVAKAFDPRYAQELSSLSGTGTLIASGDRVVASTLPPDTVRALTPASLRTLPPSAIVSIGGSEHAVKLLFRDGDVAIYAVDSIGASTRVPMQNALRADFDHRARRVRARRVREHLARQDDLAPDRHAVAVALRDDEVARLRQPRSANGLQPRSRYADGDVQHDDAVGQHRRGRDAQRVCRRDPRARAGARRAGSVYRRPLRAGRRRVGRGRPSDGAAGRSDRDPPAWRAAARHRQDRHQRQRAAQAGRADARRVRADQNAPGRRRTHPAQRAVPRAAACRSSSCTTSGPMARATRIGCAATKSLSSRASSTSPTRSMRSPARAPIVPRAAPPKPCASSGAARARSSTPRSSRLWPLPCRRSKSLPPPTYAASARMARHA